MTEYANGRSDVGNGMMLAGIGEASMDVMGAFGVAYVMGYIGSALGGTLSTYPGFTECLKNIFNGNAPRLYNLGNMGGQATKLLEAPNYLIHWGKQGKHILNHNNYIRGRSILTGDANKMLHDYLHGNVNNYQIINSTRVRINFNYNIGQYINMNTIQETKNVIMHISGKGIHFVPAAP